MRKFLLTFALLALSFFQPLSSIAPAAHAEPQMPHCAAVDVSGNPLSVAAGDKFSGGIFIDTNGGADISGDTRYYIYVSSDKGVSVVYPLGQATVSNDPKHTIKLESPNTQRLQSDTLQNGANLTFYVTSTDRDTSGVGLIQGEDLCQVDKKMQLTVGGSSSAPGIASDTVNCSIDIVGDLKDIKPGTDIKIRVNFKSKDSEGSNPGNDPSTTHQIVKVQNDRFSREKDYTSTQLEDPGGQSIGALGEGVYQIVVQREVHVLYSVGCSRQLGVGVDGAYSTCLSYVDCANDPAGHFCLPNPDKNNQLTCMPSNNDKGINPCVRVGNHFVCQTAIGGISTDPTGFGKAVLQLFFALSGLILLFTIIGNGYKFMTSQGDEEKVKEAREGITSAFVGLLVVFFGIVILQFITIDILHLPGFGK